MIRNDLHVHSVQSACGLHTIFEIVQIAARKGMRLVSITDHGPASGRHTSFGVISDRRRLPDPVVAPDGSELRLLRGIEASILDANGTIDVPKGDAKKLDLINAGFHWVGKLKPFGKAADNTKALEACVTRQSIDILTHPCIKPFPLDLPVVVDLAVAHGFALEVNNTNLRLAKTNLNSLRRMIELASSKGARLVEDSDGHTHHEIGENESIEAFVHELGLDPDQLFLNRDDVALEAFVAERRAKRQPRHDG